MSKDKGRAVQPFDDVRHSKGLSAAGNSHKGLLPHTVFDSLNQCLDCLRLVTRELIIRNELKMIHSNPPKKKIRTIVFPIIPQSFYNVKSSPDGRLPLFFYFPHPLIFVREERYQTLPPKGGGNISDLFYY